MLQLTLELNKSTFAAGEPISGKITLRNTGPESVEVNGRMALNAPFSPRVFREVALALQDPSGAPMDFQARVNIGAPRDNHFKSLAPGEVTEKTYNLADYYAFDKPGTYTVQATYQNQSQPAEPNGHAAWQGELTAPTVSFSVLP